MRTKNIAMILTLALTAGLCQTAAPSQAATPKLNTKNLTIKVGKTAALKVKKTSKKAKWSIVSGKKNIRLTAKKKTSVKVKAVKAGKAKISCKIGKKKLICKVTVYGPIPPCVIPTQSPTVTASAAPTQSPAVTASATPSQTPELQKKNDADVTELQNIIKTQQTAGAAVSGDIDDSQYEWSTEGRLKKIKWDNLRISGELSLEKLDGLEEVSCQNNELTKLIFGKNMVLKSVNCTNNKLVLLTVNQCYGLQYLYCKGNLFTSLDIAGLNYLLNPECDEGVKIWRAPE